jgi:hypothetical protein
MARVEVAIRRHVLLRGDDGGRAVSSQSGAKAPGPLQMTLSVVPVMAVPVLVVPEPRMSGVCQTVKNKRL